MIDYEQYAKEMEEKAKEAFEDSHEYGRKQYNSFAYFLRFIGNQKQPDEYAVHSLIEYVSELIYNSEY